MSMIDAIETRTNHMMTQKQRSELMDAYRDEPLCVVGTLLKSAAGLVVIGGLALVGTTRESTDIHVAQAQGSVRYSAAKAMSAYRQHSNASASRSVSANRIPQNSVELRLHTSERLEQVR